MIFLSPFLLSLSSNLDTLSVSLSYGIKKIYLPKSIKLTITILTTIITFISMYIGKLLTPLFGNELANIFGAVLLCFIGISFIVEYIRLEKKRAGYDTSYFYENPLGYKNVLENPVIIDADKSNQIDLKECINLCFAISYNNIFTFFAASLTGIYISISLFLYFLTSILAIQLGSFCYNWLTFKLLKKYSCLISGTILILLGIMEAFI